MSKTAWGIACTAAAALGTAALYQGLVERSYTIDTGKWRQGNSLRFAVVADLHSQLFGEGQKGLLQPIRRQLPDFILAPGDIVDERVPVTHARSFMRGAAEIAPTFYVPGNHEYRTGRMRSVFRLVESCGAVVLADRYERLRTGAGELVLAGCEDPEKTRRQNPFYDQRRSLGKAFAPIAETEAFSLLLAHRPDRVELYKSLGFDLVVSGHAHGGQVRIPWLVNGLYATNQGLLPPYAGGCYRHDGLHHIVSRGVAKYKCIPRVFNPPEIVFINVVGTGK